MKRIILIVVTCFVAAILSGCCSDKNLLTEKLEAQNIETIQVVLAMGNPEYGADSKVIRDESEIQEFVNAFNGASIGKRVKKVDEAVSDASKYFFYGDDESLLLVFYFNGNDSERIWYNSNWHYISYSGKKPFELYKDSQAESIVVDEDLNIMDKGLHE